LVSHFLSLLAFSSSAALAGGELWSYQGETGPGNWGSLSPEWATCFHGQYQSPIDLSGGIEADLGGVEANIKPSKLRFGLDGPTFAVPVDAGSMLTINGALTVDLSGQIGVYAIGPRVYSGTGGQLAFHLGAVLSRRGRAVTVLPSTARRGSISTIVPQFEQGQIVSIPRELADTVVTDQGVARLLGKSVRERAEELIAAAHPDHRERLRQEARRLYYP
jgi:hypothetical protein